MTQISNNFIAGYAKNAESALLDNKIEKQKLLSKQEINSEKKLKEATDGFEALLLQEMFKSLWSTVETKGWTGEAESNEAKIYRDMLNQALADSIASGKGIGIKDVVRKEFDKGNVRS
jgi:flagellar protein FlgJ